MDITVEPMGAGEFAHQSSQTGSWDAKMGAMYALGFIVAFADCAGSPCVLVVERRASLGDTPNKGGSGIVMLDNARDP